MQFVGVFIFTGKNAHTDKTNFVDFTGMFPHDQIPLHSLFGMVSR